METGTSRSAALGLAAIALALGGCGGKAHSSSSPGRSSREAISGAPGRSQRAASGPFDWLHPGPSPVGWPVASIPAGAAMPYPPGWRRIESDRGTATAAFLNSHHQFLGYLNLTPRQSNETLTNWGRFRVEHNAAENDRSVSTLAVATGLRFRAARGTCVRDAYTTRTGTRYIELACLVSGKALSAVIVGASPPRSWPRISPLLERAISSTIT
jgi:hypothetical protein